MSFHRFDYDVIANWIEPGERVLQAGPLGFDKQRHETGIVDHLLKDVQGGVGSGIHARPLLDGFQSFENADGALGISRGGGLDRHKNRCRQIGRQSFSICVFLQYKRTIG